MTEKSYSRIQPGDVIIAKVTKMIDWGIILKYQDLVGVLMLPEVSYYDTPIGEVAEVGQPLKVYVIEVIDDDKVDFSASLIRLTPEQNPFTDPAILFCGMVFEGTITHIGFNFSLVRHPLGLSGILSRSAYKEPPIAGANIAVMVKQINPERRDFHVVPKP
ncbi:MAG: S1 RNA-binding domain-containing protein [Planctomycetota bacterium]|nr:S1 RNA-binding domain-containing protein [Planctomycetota bacterium]